MEHKLTFEEYIQKLSDILEKEITIDTIKEDISNNTDSSKIEKAKQKIEAYKRYCNLTEESAFDEKDINLSKEIYFSQNRNAVGSFADFWFVLYDLKSYLLKEIVPERFIKNSNGSKYNKIISNSIVIPEVIEALGLESAKYYITDYWDDTADNLYTNLYLVTPDFLQEGEELYSIKDIVGLGVTDVIDLENKIRNYYRYKPFSNDQKEALIKQFIKAVVINKIIDNTDENNENMSIIVNSEKKTVKLAPLYDYDFCCENQSYKDSKRTINGKSNLSDFINYYKKYPWFEQWLKEKVLTLNIDEILSKYDKKVPNKPTITDESKRFYKSFFAQKKRIIKECLNPEIKITNKILDYEQVLEQLDKIAKKGIIQKADNIGISEHGLSIEQYIVGNGKNHIVITGATHGCEIITTDFILKLMNDISDKNSEWKLALKDFTIHFIPLLNPEGYLISTSAIRAIIPRDMASDVAEKICKEYYEYYRSDDIIDSKIKKHQEMFANIDYTCIPEKYPEIRASVKRIFELYPDLPSGCLQTWSANANGIDIQANSEFNPANAKINNGEEIYMRTKRNNNINIAHPGPINCPFDKNKGAFKQENETKAISNLLDKLNKNQELFAYLNYHSTGGMIFQRPAIKPEKLDVPQEQILEKELFNYLCARIYSDKTIRDKQKNESYRIYPAGLPTIKSRADIQNTPETNRKINNSPATSLNDIFRLKYPLDLLIELSAMGGNPIGPYGDMKGNYKNVMESNTVAVKQLLEYATIIKKVSEECAKVFSKFGNKVVEPDGEQYQIKVRLLDHIYIEFMEKVESLKKANTMKKDKEDYEKR